MQLKSKVVTPEEAMNRIARYCAYQERSHQEVRNKLYSFGLRTSDVEMLLSRMITDGFLNEERFARAFAGGKFRLKKWGRNKIIHELEALQVSSRCIRSGLEEIDQKTYLRTLEGLLKKKLATLDEPNPFRRKDRAARFVIAKGYEPPLVWELLKELEGE